MLQRTQKMNQQKGIALIMVLLVVALVTIIATGIASNQKLSTRRTSNLLNNEQAYMYLLGAEDWAKDILIDDVNPNNNTDSNNATEDSLNDLWAFNLNPIPVEGGVITGRIEDLQARFNINNIIDRATDTPNAANITLLRNLFVAINAQSKNTNIPNTTDAVLDWIDANPDALQNGAEDGEYLNRPQSYVAANRIMASASELVKVNGFDYSLANLIAPYVIALPEATPININTASEMQFRMLVQGLSDSQIKDIIDQRGTTGFATIADFTNLSQVPNNIDQSLIALRSNYFLLTASSVIGNSRAELYSILHRGVNPGNSQVEVKVLLRSQRRI